MTDQPTDTTPADRISPLQHDPFDGDDDGDDLALDAPPRLDPARRVVALAALAAVVAEQADSNPLGRPRTINVHRMSKRELADPLVARYERRQLLADYGRPETRADCEPLAPGESAEDRPHGQRPCPFATCKYHLAVDVMENGNYKLNFPDIDIADMPMTCVLDIADQGGLTLEEVGAMYHLTRERIRQLESEVLVKLIAAVDRIEPAAASWRAAALEGLVREHERRLAEDTKRRLPLLNS